MNDNVTTILCLPVIALDLFDISEAVQDMKTGLLIKPASVVKYYMWNGAPNNQDKTLWLMTRHRRPWIVKRTVEKATLLIENGSLGDN